MGIRHVDHLFQYIDVGDQIFFSRSVGRSSSGIDYGTILSFSDHQINVVSHTGHRRAIKRGSVFKINHETIDMMLSKIEETQG